MNSSTPNVHPRLGFQSNKTNALSLEHLTSPSRTECTPSKTDKNPSQNETEGSFVAYAPDGGYSWIIVGASFFSNFVLDGISLCPGVLQSVIQEASGKIVTNSSTELLEDENTDMYEISVGMYSLVGSILLAMQLLIGPLISLMTNRFGFRGVAMVGSLTASSGIFLSWALSPSVPNIWLLLIFYGVVGGLGFGMMFQPSIVIVSMHFEKKRALATGIAICGTGVGSIVFPLFMNHMIALGGWQAAFLAQATIALLSTSFGFLYRPLPLKFVPKDSLNKDFQTEVKNEETSCVPMMKSMGPLCQSPTFFILAISGAITTLGFFAPYAFVPGKSMTELNMSEDSAVFAVTTIGISNTIGRLLFGYIADRPWINQLILSNTALTICGIATVLVPLMTSEYQMYLYVIVFGLTTAIFAVLRSVLIMKFMGMEKFNNSFGLALLFMGVTTLIGNPIGGWLKDMTGRYDYSFYAAGVYFIVSGVMCYPLQWVKNWETKRQNVILTEKL